MRYYLKKHWKINALTISLQIAWGALFIYSNLASMQMIQALLDLNFPEFLRRFVIYLGIFAVLDVLEIGRSWGKSKSKMLMNNSIRGDIGATILSTGHKDFHQAQIGEYLSWYTNDINQITTNAWDVFYSMISIGTQVITGIICIATLHWSLLVLSIPLSLIIIYSPKLAGSRVEKLGAECAERQGKATGQLKDLLSGLDVLKFFGRTDRFVSGSDKASQEMELPKHKLNMCQTLVGTGVDFINELSQFSIYLLSGFLAFKGLMIPSGILASSNLCGTLYCNLVYISKNSLVIRSTKTYFDKITVHAQDTQPSGQSPALPPVKEGITVENLSFAYEGKPVLENASFRFQQGGKYALTGPSGCGKSTLLKLLLGWLPDYTGKIAFDGEDAKSFSPDQLQQQMSYIEQDVFLFNTTIRENITLGEDFPQEQLDRAIRCSALDGDLKTMPQGLDTLVGEDGSCLSGGQKQRVAIARALVHNRSILLVDEGTSALDQKNADIVEQSLLSNPDLTLILVSHHLTDQRKAQFDKVYNLEPVLTK